jgi:hypothetical protein
MKNINHFLILLSCFQASIGMQQNRNPEQLVQQALAELPKIREELEKPSIPNNQPEQLVHSREPSPQTIETHKRKLQGDALNKICNAISVGGERLHAQRTAQEAIAHVTIITAAAQEAALQERFEQKAVNLADVESIRRRAEQELGILQEIKQKKEHQKAKTAEYQKACKDLKFLIEQKELDDKLDQLTGHLSRLDFELTAEIIKVQQTLHALKKL